MPPECVIAMAAGEGRGKPVFVAHFRCSFSSKYGVRVALVHMTRQVTAARFAVSPIFEHHHPYR